MSETIPGATADISDRALEILSVAGRLFAEAGYDGTSMRDIAEACGITKATLYHHFADKQALHDRIALGITRQLFLFVDEAVAPHAAPLDRLRVFMTASAAFFERYRWAWIASVNTAATNRRLRLRPERVVWGNKQEALLRSILEDAVEQGLLRPTDLSLTIRLVLSALNWMSHWFEPEKELTAAEIAERFYDMILNGLRSEGGREESREGLSARSE